MKRKGMHYAKLENSHRLKNLLLLLKCGRELSTMELSLKCGIYALSTAISELRHQGYNIECRREGRKWLYSLK